MHPNGGTPELNLPGMQAAGTGTSAAQRPDGARQIPRHVAIIMDGNGRWAKRRLMPRKVGHRAGARNLKRITRHAAELGVQYLTVYAFSTENWRRPDDEVSTLMKLFIEFLGIYSEELAVNSVRMRFCGCRAALPSDVQAAMEAAERESAGRTGMQLILAFNYGGRDEILRAVHSYLAEAAGRGEELGTAAARLDAEALRAHFDLPDVPDPDLIIRTSGERRLSNFLLWQAAYSELYVCPELWPDFSETSLDRAFRDYAARGRRYGGITNE